MRALEQIRAELDALGLSPRIVPRTGFDFGAIVAFRFEVNVGRFKGQRFEVGIGFQENGYPEYPPHFLCIASLPDSVLPVHSCSQVDGSDWCAFSVPPSDFWDSLPTSEKNMKTYVRRHLVRFWGQI